MRIASRIIAIFLPLFLAPMVFLALISTTTAREGITTVATEFLEFKASELTRFAQSEYDLLSANGLEDSPQYIDAAKRAVANYAKGLTRGSTELIAAFEPDGAVAFSTSDVSLLPGEGSRLLSLIAAGKPGWIHLTVAGTRRVADLSFFKPFSWALVVSEKREAFFKSVDRITIESGITTGVSLLTVILLVIVLSGLITRPLNQVVQAMRDIVKTRDLTRRVEVPYADEVGELGDGFNAMTSALEQAYGEIKSYALKAAIAQRREMKIRNVFQKYVPNQVIEQFFASPESMLVGEDRALAILFSDIRDFTSLSEGMSSREIVESLNQYFGRMVDAIMQRRGLVDKYIGDAIMAFFGAPADDEQSALHSVQAGLAMNEELAAFNAWQSERGRTPIRIGVGINYGTVTVGNIGSEAKMDYTVIGDMVNVASRLEGLTKFYQEPILISESVQQFVVGKVPCRLVDRVQVKGRKRGLAIYGVRGTLSEREERAWTLHEEALHSYYDRDFAGALRRFTEVVTLLPEDAVAPAFVKRCRLYLASPPPADWTGVVAHTQK